MFFSLIAEEKILSLCLKMIRQKKRKEEKRENVSQLFTINSDKV